MDDKSGESIQEEIVAGRVVHRYIFMTRSNPTNQLTDPTQSNPLQVENFGPNPNKLKVTVDVWFETGSGCKMSLSN